MCIVIFKPVLLDLCWHPVGFRKDYNNDCITTELQSVGWVPVKTSCSFQSWQLAPEKFGGLLLSFGGPANL